jgi:hypothetical protein
VTVASGQYKQVKNKMKVPDPLSEVKKHTGSKGKPYLKDQRS